MGGGKEIGSASSPEEESRTSSSAASGASSASIAILRSETGSRSNAWILPGDLRNAKDDPGCDCSLTPGAVPAQVAEVETGAAGAEGHFKIRIGARRCGRHGPGPQGVDRPRESEAGIVEPDLGWTLAGQSRQHGSGAWRNHKSRVE